MTYSVGGRTDGCLFGFGLLFSLEDCFFFFLAKQKIDELTESESLQKNKSSMRAKAVNSLHTIHEFKRDWSQPWLL